MATNPNEVGGQWVRDPANPNRATYTTPDGSTYEVSKDDLTPRIVTPTQPSVVSEAPKDTPAPKVKTSLQFLDEPDELGGNVLKEKAAGIASIFDQMVSDRAFSSDDIRAFAAKTEKEQGFAFNNLEENLKRRDQGLGVSGATLDPKLDDPLNQRIEVDKTPRKISAAQRAVLNFEEATQYAFPGWVARSWYDWSDYGKDQLREQFPGHTEDWYEQMQTFAVRNGQKMLRQGIAEELARDPAWKPDQNFFEAAARIDRWGPAFIGQALGSAGPESLINPGSSVGARIASQSAVGAASDAAYQGLDIMQGISDDLDVDSILMNVAASGVTQGVFETPGFIRDLFKKRGSDTTPGGPVVGEDAPAPEPESRVVAQMEGDPVEARLANEANQFLSRREAVDSTNPAGFETDQVAHATKVRAQAQSAKVDEAVTKINEITKDWTNAPSFEVLRSLNDIEDETLRQSIDKDAIGIRLDDGRILINMKNVEGPDALSSVTFHEALGHHGLDQKFGTDLPRMMEEFYYNSKGSFKKEVDGWLKDNPDYYPKDTPNLLSLAVEEVLARQSEGGRVEAGIMSRIRNFIKDYGRQMGLDLKYSDGEIRTILAMAHDATINGAPNAASNGFRYQKVFHGTPKDEPFEAFDHSHMGSGEGAQVFGWGTYLTDVREVADKFYRERLLKPSVEFNGMEFNLPRDGTSLKAQIVGDFIYSRPAEREWFEDNNIWRQARNAVDGYLSSFNKDIDPTPRYLAERGSIRSREWLDNHPETYGPGTVFDELSTFLKKELPVRKTGDNNKGTLYEVEIPDDATWLTLDSPLKDQSPAVKKFFARELMPTVGKMKREIEQSLVSDRQLLDELIAIKKKSNDPQTVADLDLDIVDYQSMIRRDERLLEGLSNPTGKDIYNMAVDKFGSPKSASEALNKAGISGNKYKTGLARGTSKNQFNYVVFDDKTPKIVARYMKKPKTPVVKETSGDDITAARLSNATGLNPSKIRVVGDIDDYLHEFNAVTDRTNISDAEIEASAIAKGINPKKLSQRQGLREKSLTEYLFRSNLALSNQLQRVVDLEKKISDGSFTINDQVKTIEELATLKALFSRVNEDRSEMGRAFRILQKIQESKKSAKSVEEILESADLRELGDPKNLRKFMKLIRDQIDQGNDDAAIKMVKDAMKPGLFDYVMSIRYNMMLSNPGTHVANFAGTGGHVLVDLLAHTGAAVAGQGKRFSNAERVRMREVAYRVYGMLQAVKTANTWAQARKSLNTGLTGNAATEKTGHAGNLPWSSLAREGSLMQGVLGGLEAPTRLLAGADEWWRNVLEMSNIYGLAVRNAGNRGLKGKHFWDEVGDLINNPTKEMIDNSSDYTKRMQFLDKPSAIADGIIKAQNKFPVLKFPVPFVRTPDSLIRATLANMGPLGVMERRNLEGWKKGGAERDIVKARLIMGSAFAFWAASQAMADKVTGEGPSDAAKRKQWLATHQPNSVKIGDKWVSIAGLEPLSSLITIPATVMERKEAGEIKDKDLLSQVSSTIHTISGTIANNIYLEDFKGFLDIFDKDPEVASRALDDQLANAVVSTTVPAIARRVAQSEDPFVRGTGGDGSFTDRLEGNMTSATVGLSKTLPKQYDVYGRPLTREFLGPDLASRSAVRPVEKDPTVKELDRLSKFSDKVLVGPPGRNIKVNGEQRRLTEREFQNYQHLSGYYLTKIFEEQMKTPEYKKMTRQEKLDLVKDIKDFSREEARKLLFNPDGEQESTTTE